MDHYKENTTIFDCSKFKEDFLKDYHDPVEDIPGKPLTMAEKRKLVDELCEGIGSVATGRDNPPRLSKRKLYTRSIDETWEGG